jgi:hypothetical protein
MTRLPNNVAEAREWAKLAGRNDGDRERRWIARAFLVGYRGKQPGDALVIEQKLYDDAWRLGRKCRQYKQEAETAERGSGGPSDAYYRQHDRHPLRVRVSSETLTKLGAIADSLPVGKQGKAEATMHAIDVAHAMLEKSSSGKAK